MNKMKRFAVGLTIAGFTGMVALVPMASFAGEAKKEEGKAVHTGSAQAGKQKEADSKGKAKAGEEKKQSAAPASQKGAK
jgi:hypothetical protein